MTTLVFRPVCRNPDCWRSPESHLAEDCGTPPPGGWAALHRESEARSAFEERTRRDRSVMRLAAAVAGIAFIAGALMGWSLARMLL